MNVEILKPTLVLDENSLETGVSIALLKLFRKQASLIDDTTNVMYLLDTANSQQLVQELEDAGLDEWLPTSFLKYLSNGGTFVRIAWNSAEVPPSD